ncbi:hypothetical protein [Nocardia spumae]|uniref:hypothetical protein n=1 Tax=Nocardia spumae TaxID=2887190 RepID=UPI001D15A44D|nr:hypothetical protein [Nocardia spumae]
MDAARSTLEFVNALKWPVIVLVLATMYRDPMGRVLERLRPKLLTVDTASPPGPTVNC